MMGELLLQPIILLTTPRSIKNGKDILLGNIRSCSIIYLSFQPLKPTIVHQSLSSRFVNLLRRPLHFTKRQIDSLFPNEPRSKEPNYGNLLRSLGQLLIKKIKLEEGESLPWPTLSWSGEQFPHDVHFVASCLSSERTKKIHVPYQFHVSQVTTHTNLGSVMLSPYIH